MLKVCRYIVHQLLMTGQCRKQPRLITLEGGCFVLSSNQFCRRKDYPPAPEYVFEGSKEELTPDYVVCVGGSVIVSPLGEVLAGPNYEGEGLITAYLDLRNIVRAKFEFDSVGHYSRPEVLSLTVYDQPTKPVTLKSNSTKTEEKTMPGTWPEPSISRRHYELGIC